MSSLLPPLLLIVPVFALRLVLLLRQRAALRADAAPPYARAVVTQRVGAQLWQSLWALLVLLSIPLIDRLADARGASFALAVVVIAGWFWELPAKAWKVFVTDAAHGFNRLGPARFLREQTGRALLFIVAAAPAAPLAVAWSGRPGGWSGWLLIWGTGWLGHVVLRWLQPRWIAPRFESVEPLPQGALRDRLNAVLARCGVARQRLFVSRASARTGQANAQVSGGLAAPRIVLADTLIDLLPAEEVEAVVAHELGHLQRGHLRVQQLMLGALWFVLVALIAALTAGVPGTAPRLALAWSLMPSAWLLAQPIANAVYRRFEFEADESAAANSSAAAMAAALRRLTRNNANAARNDRWYERVYHTHPATAARLARLERAAA